MRHGTDPNKRELLPPIATGELTCAVGYSEPDAGTDLASLRTRAVREDDEWVDQRVQDPEQRTAQHTRVAVRALLSNSPSWEYLTPIRTGPLWASEWHTCTCSPGSA